MKISISTVALLLVAYSHNTHAIKTLERQRNSHDVDVESSILLDVIAEADFSGEEQTLWQRLLVDTVASMPLTGKIIKTLV